MRSSKATGERPPTLSRLRKEARRVYGPDTYLTQNGASVAAWVRMTSNGWGVLRISVQCSDNADARRALLAALMAMPDYEGGK